MKTSACPLDCFDSCALHVSKDGTISAQKDHPITQGYLCANLNHFHDFERIKSARVGNKEVSLNEALDVLQQRLKKTEPSKTLFFKGSGNLGVMQGVTKLFFKEYGSHIAKGSLCEDAGTAGIEEGRGASLAWSPSEVAKSEVVVVWGRNISTTNSHMLPALKGKKLIVIDPVAIDLAKKASLHIQIRPRSDIYLAMLLARVAFMEQLEDEEFIEKRTDNFDYFIDMVNAIPMKELMRKSGVNLNDIGEFLRLIKDKKVSFLVGIGVQKYSFGHSVLRAIDSFVAMMGLFGKEGCGVGYVANSAHGFKSAFQTSKKETSVPMPIVDFGKYDLVFIQGANPANQMPCTPKVKEGLKKAAFVVYFGVHENATSRLADLVIPAKNFLEKEDVKLSYGHEYIGLMQKVLDSNEAISEYELTCKLNEQFLFEEPLSEKEYIEELVASNSYEKDGRLLAGSLKKTPYSDTFYTPNGKFEFFDEFYDDMPEEATDEGFFLLSSKHNKSLNSQFQTDEFLYVPPTLGLKDGDWLELANKEYTCIYTVKVDPRLRSDCLRINSGHKDANMLTAHAMSEEGNCAIFQEQKVYIKSRP